MRVALEPPDAVPPPARVPALLRAVVVAAFVLPADMVFAPLGAIGYVTMILALTLGACWVAAVAWNVNDPAAFRFPARIGLALFWLSTVSSYVRMSTVTDVQRAAADRWILMLLAMTALTLVTAESVRSIDSALSFTAVVVGAATVCALVAVYQFTIGTDPLDHVRTLMVGMTDNGVGTTFQTRGLLTRVAGNTFTPIELGIVMAMVLPLAVWRALVASRGRAWVHWSQCLLITVACVITVSRSAVLGLLVAVTLTVPFLPPAARRWAAIAVPGVVVVLFVAVPGLIATLRAAVLADAATDPSLATRVDNYPRVQAMVIDHPVVGTGPATYIPDDALLILDNQYLHTAVEQGLVGLVAFATLVVLPVVSSVVVAAWTREPRLRLLAAAVGAACGVAAAGSAVFDSLSFPVFVIVFPLFLGLSGSVWTMARRAAGRDHLDPPDAPVPARSSEGDR
ncbi:O-antigen ligase family protein [Rhodococcus kroppenstedtii]|uniref:O-antigen ligase family protein n=1 Tax=Rhodococcoides kroppenstedtii TaxID=293050 RepID=UPI001C9A4DB6|nr:O-antigen ligase family protein [Rhodococcus kroppenstedtii]MBY6436596.1 O-antigen ligase family protein [Rhodococcus kroppenstedtii]